MYKKPSFFKSLIAILLLVTIIFSTTACSSQIQATDLTKGITSNTVTGKSNDGKFTDNISNFSIDLFKSSIDEKENSLISPLSVLLALAMTANGADGETRTQMEKVLGGNIPLDELNDYLYTYIDKTDFHIANSIWFRDEESLKVNKDFLQTNMDYYKASIYKAPFNNDTVKDINTWVSKNTNGMIEEILNEIGDMSVLYLFNAIAFEGEWEDVYRKNDISDGDFTDINGETSRTPFMNSDESIYLEDREMARGFIKPYAGDEYSFMALLPDEDIDFNDYIKSLTGEKFNNILSNAKEKLVAATLPKFSYDYTIEMNDILKRRGMEMAFDPDRADFNLMASSTKGNIYIQEVHHKTFITVDELGTKAGAVTKVEMGVTSAPEKEYVILDRPFLYAIIDNSTNLPIFIGTVVNFS